MEKTWIRFTSFILLCFCRVCRVRLSRLKLKGRSNTVHIQAAGPLHWDPCIRGSFSGSPQAMRLSVGQQSMGSWGCIHPAHTSSLLDHILHTRYTGIPGSDGPQPLPGPAWAGVSPGDCPPEARPCYWYAHLQACEWPRGSCKGAFAPQGQGWVW